MQGMPAMHRPVTAPYKPRRVRALDTWRCRGWTLKRYVVEIAGRLAGEADLERAQNEADARLVELETSDPARHGLGFLILHLGENGDYLLVETWTDQDILSHVNYGAAKGGKYRSDWPGPGACVWELAVMCHEREAWLRHMLRTDGNPDPVAWEADLL